MSLILLTYLTNYSEFSSLFAGKQHFYIFIHRFNSILPREREKKSFSRRGSKANCGKYVKLEIIIKCQENQQNQNSCN